MHQRTTSESVSPDAEDASNYTDDKSDDKKKDASENSSLHHLLSMTFLSAMLIW